MGRFGIRSQFDSESSKLQFSWEGREVDFSQQAGLVYCVFRNPSKVMPGLYLPIFTNEHRAPNGLIRDNQ